MKQIASERTLKGLSQSELGKELGVHRVTVSHWETGVTYPQIEKLIQMAELFGCSTDYLLGKTMERT